MVEPLFGPVLGSVHEFIDYALLLVSVLIIYYIVKFFLVERPSKEERDKAWAEGGKGLSEYISNKMKERAEKDSRSKKKDLVSPMKENLKDAIEAAEDTWKHLNSAERKKAYHRIDDIKDHIEKAVRNLQLLRRNLNDTEKDTVTKMIHELHAAEETFLREVKGKLPKRIITATKAEWDAAVAAAAPEIRNLLGSLGNAWKNLEQFHG